jgi:hypothetical protein
MWGALVFIEEEIKHVGADLHAFGVKVLFFTPHSSNMTEH